MKMKEGEIVVILRPLKKEGGFGAFERHISVSKTWRSEK